MNPEYKSLQRKVIGLAGETSFMEISLSVQEVLRLDEVEAAAIFLYM